MWPIQQQQQQHYLPCNSFCVIMVMLAIICAMCTSRHRPSSARTDKARRASACVLGVRTKINQRSTCLLELLAHQLIIILIIIILISNHDSIVSAHSRAHLCEYSARICMCLFVIITIVVVVMLMLFQYVHYCWSTKHHACDARRLKQQIE